MLSDRERQELALIEQRLQAEDRRFADGFQIGPRARRIRRWPTRALLVFGVFVMAVGVLTSTEMLVMQGVLCVGAAIVWMRRQAVQAARAAVADGVVPRPGARPDGPATGRGSVF
jgi:hypothetical protein